MWQLCCFTCALKTALDSGGGGEGRKGAVFSALQEVEMHSLRGFCTSAGCGQGFRREGAELASEAFNLKPGVAGGTRLGLRWDCCKLLSITCDHDS